MSTHKLEAQKLRQDNILLPDVYITWNLRVFRILTKEDFDKTFGTTLCFIIHNLGKPRLFRAHTNEDKWRYEVYEVQYGETYPLPDESGYIGNQRWYAEELFNFFQRPINDIK